MFFKTGKRQDETASFFSIICSCVPLLCSTKSPEFAFENDNFFIALLRGPLQTILPNRQVIKCYKLKHEYLNSLPVRCHNKSTFEFKMQIPQTDLHYTDKSFLLKNELLWLSFHSFSTLARQITS